MKKPPRLRAGIVGCLAFIALTALAADGPKTISLFNGKDLSGWKLAGGKNLWQYGRAALDPADPRKLTVTGPGDELITTNKGANLKTDASFGDCKVELEFMMAKNSNSGVKLMSIYEIQIYDSYGRTNLNKEDCGAIYAENAPLVNACKKPGKWQKLVIDFRAPRFDESGKKTANARFVKVALNGRVVQENVEIAHGTNVSRNAPEHPAAPLYLQGDHGAVAFRNVKITPLN